jgi:hypothetical protein
LKIKVLASKIKRYKATKSSPSLNRWPCSLCPQKDVRFENEHEGMNMVISYVFVVRWWMTVKIEYQLIAGCVWKQAIRCGPCDPN